MWGHQDHSEGRALPSVSIFRGQEAEGLTAVRLYLGYAVQPLHHLIGVGFRGAGSTKTAPYCCFCIFGMASQGLRMSLF